MAEESKTLRLSCLCGAAKTEIELPESTFPITAAFCHCNSCRHMTGCLCSTSIPLLTEDHYRPSGELLEKLTAFEFSIDTILAYFCSNCGTQILAQLLPSEKHGYKRRWFATCGAIENIEGVYHPRHDYLADTVDSGCSDFFESLNGRPIERWSQHPNQSDRLPLHWRAREAPQPETSRTNKLHCHCKCKGIEFWISRATDKTRYAAMMCGCDSCRLSRGMEWCAGGMALIPISQLFHDNEGRSVLDIDKPFGTSQIYQPSPNFKRAFCHTCGATVFAHKEGTEIVSVAVGLLDAPAGARAETWLEWDVANLHFREDSISRAKSLTTAGEEGMRKLQARRQ